MGGSVRISKSHTRLGREVTGLVFPTSVKPLLTFQEMVKNSKGAIDILVVVFLAGMASGVFASSWNPFYKILNKKPPTEQVAVVQQQLEAAQLAAKAQEAQLKTANAQERALLESEVQSAQQDNEGTVEALKRVSPEHATAEVNLAKAMAQRVSFKLAMAIGDLPADQKSSMILLIDQALSEKQSEVDEANRKLAQRDKDFLALSKQHEEVVTKVIPALEKKTEQANGRVDELSNELAAKTGTLAQWAKDKFNSDAEKSGLRASLDRMFYWIFWAVGGYLFLAYVLPGIVKHLKSGKFKNFLRDVSGFILNPLLHLDAKKKIEAKND